MADWWRQFWELPDRERAKLLARIAFGLIIALLYALGGLGLYLRARYLEPATTPPPSVFSGEPTSARPSPTLYPTITPRPIGETRVSGTPDVVFTQASTPTASPTNTAHSSVRNRADVKLVRRIS